MGVSKRYSILPTYNLPTESLSLMDEEKLPSSKQIGEIIKRYDLAKNTQRRMRDRREGKKKVMTYTFDPVHVLTTIEKYIGKVIEKEPSGPLSPLPIDGETLGAFPDITTGFVQ